MTHSTTIAVMQPYFMPYAGYFRLMAAADIFVVYDCVQFPKGGWVHRNRLPDEKGNLRWLTLPIQRPSLGTQIKSLAFLPDADQVMRERLAPFPRVFAHIQSNPLLLPSLRFDSSPVDYLTTQLETISRYLGLSTKFVRASILEPSLQKPAAERVIEIVQKLGGSTYVNTPGGRGLYDASMFAASGIELRFLVDHPGPSTSILHRLVHENLATLHDEIAGATRFQ